jgi:hypothetical protein
MAGHVASGEVPALVVLLSRHGTMPTEVLGSLARAHGAPMQGDTWFGNTSMTQADHGRGGHEYRDGLAQTSAT